MRNFFFKFLTSIAVCSAAIASLKTGYVWLTDGFSLSNITSNHVDQAEWEVEPLTLAQQEEIEKALSQEYTYLGKGHQAYAFVSADGRYVLKFLKFQPYRYLPIVNSIPLPASLNKWRRQKLAHKAEKRDSVFRSWKLAFGALKEETGVLYIHINRTAGFNKTVKLRNKCGFTYQLPLDHYVFMVQRKAELIEHALASYVQQNKIEEGKQLIDKMLDLYISEYQRGLAEKDRYIVRNTGVYDGRPMHIDTGRLSIDEDLKDPKLQPPQLVWKTSVMLEWLKETYPALATHLETRLSSLE